MIVGSLMRVGTYSLVYSSEDDSLEKEEGASGVEGSDDKGVDVAVWPQENKRVKTGK